MSMASTLRDLQQSYDELQRVAEHAIAAFNEANEVANHNGKAVDAWQVISAVLLLIIIALTLTLIFKC